MMTGKNSRPEQQPLADIECVLFDLDGTLVDTVDLIHRSFRYAIEKVLGLTLERAQLLQNLGRPLAVQMEAFSPDRAEELLAVYNEHNLANHDRYIRRYPGTKDVLAWLRQTSRKVGVVTSKRRELSLRGLEITGLRNYVETVVAMEDTDRHKPDPEPVRAAIMEIDCSARRTVFVGDSPFDMASGREADVYTGAALWGPFDLKELRKFQPDLELNKITELKDYLLDL